MRIPCLNRLEGSRKAICLNPSLDTFKCPVKPLDCQKCSEAVRLVKLPRTAALPATPPERLYEPRMSDPEITYDGRLIYARNGWEPPLTPFGYHLVSSDSPAWILEPTEPICRHLELVPAETGSCGYRRVAKRCKLIDSFIGQKTCSTGLRRE